MAFSVLVAADVGGVKTNCELQFDAHPTFAEFKAKAEGVCLQESAACGSLFEAQRMQVYDDRVELWIDLVSAAQLKPYSQVYVFQKETAGRREVQSKIPPPCKTIVVAGHPAAAAAAASPALASPSPARVARSPSAAIYPDLSILNASAAVAAAAAAAATTLSPSPAPAATAGGDCDVAPFAEKCRCVYASLDDAHSGAVPPERFAAVLSSLRIDLSDESVRGLFAKADANGDGVLSSGELHRFAEQYPTLLDSLFYRGRDEEAEAAHARVEENAGYQLEACRERLSRAEADVAKAAAAADAQEARVAAAADAVRAAEASERDAHAVLDAAQQEAAAVRADVGRCAQGVAAERERTRAAEDALRAAEAAAAARAAAAAAQRDARAAAEARLAEIAALLAQQEANLVEQRRLEAEADAEEEAARAESQAAAGEAEERAAGLQAAAERLAVAEGELAAAQDRQREKGVAHLQARDGTARAAGAQEGEEATLAAARHAETTKKLLRDEAAGAVGTQKEACAALEAERAELRARRRESENDERPLLAEEVRLRAQRDALEQQEAALRTNHKTFHVAKGRPSVAPSQTPPHHGAGHSPSPSRYGDASPSPVPATPGAAAGTPSAAVTPGEPSVTPVKQTEQC